MFPEKVTLQIFGVFDLLYHYSLCKYLEYLTYFTTTHFASIWSILLILPLYILTLQVFGLFGPVRICQFMHSIFRFFDDI